MSASREKKNRQDLASQGIQDPKAIREAELPALQSELGRAVGCAVYDHFHPKEETP